MRLSSRQLVGLRGCSTWLAVGPSASPGHPRPLYWAGTARFALDRFGHAAVNRGRGMGYRSTARDERVVGIHTVMSVGTHSRSPGRRRAIVTGGAGFIGSHLVDRLISEGFAALVIDDLSTGRAENLDPEVRLERLDVALDELECVFRDWRPGVVYHLAAQASVPVSSHAPLRDLEVNVVGTHRVAIAARTAGADRLVFVSSGGAVYGETRRPATERSCPAPSSFYGIHKLAAEGHVALAGLPYAIVRPSNVYGPRQIGSLEGAVVAAFLDQAMHQGDLQVHGDGSQMRDFIHVRDVVDAVYRLGQPEAPVGTWNVASGRGVTVARLADIVERAYGRHLGRVYRARRTGDVAHSAISGARLRALGWRPSITLSAGIGELVRSVTGT
jgi:UDP-glucose 4-epimerase